MTKPKKQTPGRSHARGPGKTSTSISMTEELLARCRAAAKKENRSLSNWLETLVEGKLEPFSKKPGEGRKPGQ